MSCTSCHNPHYEPPAEDHAAYCREKCLACHGNHFAAKHHPTRPTAPAAICRESPVPTSPTPRVPTIAFLGARKHRRKYWPGNIGRGKPRAHDTTIASLSRLASRRARLRDLALAWQALANDGVESAEPHAESLPRNVVTDFPNDPDLLSALAYVEQEHGLTAQASELLSEGAGREPRSDRCRHGSGRH
jgi:hypothetical protein